MLGIRTRAEPGLGSTVPGVRALSGRAVERASWGATGAEAPPFASACARAPAAAWRAAGTIREPAGLQGRSPKRRASPLDAIAGIAVPVLLIHGGADTYNPTAMAHELHAAQPHADLWIVPGADHIMSYFTDPCAYRKRVEQFLRRLPQA